MKKILLIIPIILLLISCGRNSNSSVDESTNKKNPTVPSESIVYDQKNTDEKFLKSAADCETPAIYYYSSINGEIGSKTFTYGDPLGHNYVDNYCTRCNAYNDGINWGPLH